MREFDLLSSLEIRPVLLEVGSSGPPLPIWQGLAPHSIYVGFDADAREMTDDAASHYFKSLIVNKALTSADGVNEVEFFLTASPHCSSTLPPDNAALQAYIFAPLFEVERKAAVPATSLDAVVQDLNLDSIDWFKTDSQGTDLRLFQSLNENVRSRVLAVDLEPGLIDAYQGEDLFIEVQRQLMREGFWLSNMDVRGTARCRPDTLAALKRHGVDVSGDEILAGTRVSPCWTEVRYLRTVESLLRNNPKQRDFVLLWTFAMVDAQWGFALDVAAAYENAISQDHVWKSMSSQPLERMRGLARAGARRRRIVAPLKKVLRLVLPGF